MNYLTPQEFSERTGLTPSTVKQRLVHRRIEFIKPEKGKYLIPESEVVDYFTRRKELRKWKNLKYQREFEFIDTEEKAYFLGLLYADGCISNCNKEGEEKVNNFVIKISLHEHDLEILQKIKEKFSFFLLGKFDYSKYNKGNGVQYSLRYGHPSIYNDMKFHGMIERKSYENKELMKFPTTIDKHLFHHFVRGYFDGDGSISIPSKRPNLRRCEIVSVSNNFTQELNNWFIDNNCKPDIFREKVKEGKFQNQFVIEWYRTDSILKLKELLYKDATLFFIRKKEKFDSLSYIDKTIRSFNCPFCNSNNILCGGSRQMKHSLMFRYKCKDCNKRFSLKSDAQLKLCEFGETPKKDNTEPRLIEI